ncbi:hypothetical protein W97_06216 [Coniosporium apollinis CBS 100218]|uniref:3-keto-steroid reductase n=1 Tax=Coniosporium apollinis (strain CBS 100218) TaxID=1168221 RepID=R7YYE9_CONA1|nr:uncharacterized protein W97_06216 [Coniosporium apollinis CBS 100218]EON66814.1 hypothetical protein W97_06216 [Coniosporium apollinis CBS 100218]
MADDSTPNTFYALVTGANSGLGFAICTRLIDEFLQTRPQSQTLHLILTTRSRQKCGDSISRLEHHLEKTYRDIERKLPGARLLLPRRVRFQGEICDLTSILSVQRLCQKLLGTQVAGGIEKLDVLILNAGIGGWIGVNWGNAIWTILTDWVHATTWPTLKRSAVGWVVKPQLPLTARAANGKVNGKSHGAESDAAESRETREKEPPLGEVFAANVFGHYLLAHYLAPLLSASSRAPDRRGRIIWLSSLEAYAHSLRLDDFQGLRHDLAYESSKRLTDVLALTSEMPSSSPWVDQHLSCERFTSASQAAGERYSPELVKPKIYVAHPGICSTGIFPLPWILGLFMTASFYVARWLGSPWHTCLPYQGACAPVWLALAAQSTLDSIEERGGKGKWGSATDWRGRDRVARTEVEGWGWGGRVGEEVKRGRWRYAKDLTEESKVEFEELGRACWKEMEGLREEWEERLQDAGVR